MTAAALALPTSILDVPSGLHDGIADQVYRQRIPGLVSKSVLDLVHRAPALYKAWLDGAEDEPTPALLFGKAFHCALLEPDVFRRTYAVEPSFGDCRSKDNKARRDAWRAEHNGVSLITREDDETIRGMIRVIRAHPRLEPLSACVGRAITNRPIKCVPAWQ